ncbi:MAG: hypothetical protein QM632_00070 [Micrococcaceae bacterium]
MDDFGVTALSYVIAGVIFWAFIGWCAQQFFHIPGLTIAGIILGLIGGIYLVMKLDTDSNKK